MYDQFLLSTTIDNIYIAQYCHAIYLGNHDLQLIITIAEFHLANTLKCTTKYYSINEHS